MERNLRTTIRKDLFRYAGQTSVIKAFLSPGFKYTGFKYMYFWRKASKHRATPFISLMYKLVIRQLGYKYGFQIPIGMSIGEGFYIGHFGTIVINGKVQIGKNCNIAHGTTIGRANRGKSMGCPKIGDQVWIGTGAVIVGKIDIGNNVLIAPNSFVNKDVPNNSLVIGNPAQIIQKENPTAGYINHILNQN